MTRSWLVHNYHNYMSIICIWNPKIRNWNVKNLNNSGHYMSQRIIRHTRGTFRWNISQTYNLSDHILFWQIVCQNMTCTELSYHLWSSLASTSQLNCPVHEKHTPEHQTTLTLPLSSISLSLHVLSHTWSKKKAREEEGAGIGGNHQLLEAMESI